MTGHKALQFFSCFCLRQTHAKICLCAGKMWNNLPCPCVCPRRVVPRSVLPPQLMPSPLYCNCYFCCKTCPRRRATTGVHRCSLLPHGGRRLADRIIRLHVTRPTRWRVSTLPGGHGGERRRQSSKLIRLQHPWIELSHLNRRISLMPDERSKSSSACDGRISLVPGFYVFGFLQTNKGVANFSYLKV